MSDYILEHSFEKGSGWLPSSSMLSYDDEGC